MVKSFQETPKRPVRGKGFERVKTTKVGNQGIVMEKVDQGGNHGKPFTFHDKKRKNHSMGGKAFSSRLREFRDRG